MKGNAAPVKAPTTAQRERRPSEVPAKRNAQDLARALTRTSWLPGDELRLSEWVEHGRRLGVIGRGVGWWIGDWLRYGNMKFGERYVRASRITGYDVQTLMNMVYVATAYDPSQRRGGLSWSHHAELAALPAGERDRWLDQAERERLSVRCLREELRRERRIEAGQPPAAEPAALAAGAGADSPDGPAEHGGAEHGGAEHGGAAAVAGPPDVRCPQCGCRIADGPAQPAPLRVA